jgi:hypothetical protein
MWGRGLHMAVPTGRVRIWYLGVAVVWYYLSISPSSYTCIVLPRPSSYSLGRSAATGHPRNPIYLWLGTVSSWTGARGLARYRLPSSLVARATDHILQADVSVLRIRHYSIESRSC